MTATGKPRVLVLATTFPREQGDGTPEFVLSLSNGLGEHFDITVLTPRVPSAAAQERWGDLEVHRFPYFPSRWEGLANGAILPNLRAARWRIVEAPFLVLSMAWHAWRLARRLRPQIVHAHWLLPAGLIGMVLKRRFGMPFLVTVHGADVYGLKGRVVQRLRSMVMRQAAVVLPVSRDLANRLGIGNALATQHVVPMGVDMQSIESAVAGMKRDSDLFLFVGRLAEKKGVDVLLHALGEVGGARAVIVGDGPERSALEGLARDLQIDDRVRFVCHQPRSAVLRYLATAGVLVIPSRIAKDGDQDGTPVVLGEGIAAGIPVIATAVGGLAERIDSGTTGVLVSPGSAEELADALRASLKDPDEMSAMAARAHERLRGSALDIGMTAARYREIIEQLISPRQ